jgi:hypothetical protein
MPIPTVSVWLFSCAKRKPALINNKTNRVMRIRASVLNSTIILLYIYFLLKIAIINAKSIKIKVFFKSMRTISLHKMIFSLHLRIIYPFKRIINLLKRN